MYKVVNVVDNEYLIIIITSKRRFQTINGTIRINTDFTFRRDVAKQKMHLQFLCSGTLDGQYELKGSLLFVPIEGKGAIHSDLSK